MRVPGFRGLRGAWVLGAVCLLCGAGPAAADGLRDIASVTAAGYFDGAPQPRSGIANTLTADIRF
jgi:hypothetical protein